MCARRFMLLAVVAVAACSKLCLAVDEHQHVTHLTFSSTNSASVEKALSALTEKIRSDKMVSGIDCVRLQGLIQGLGKEELCDAEPGERQKVVRNILGADNYDLVEQVLTSQLQSKDRVLRGFAIRTLGQGLYSASAQPLLKEIVFGSNRDEQFVALTSLVALGTPGAHDLLMTMLLSGKLEDPMAKDAIEVLLPSHTEALMYEGPAILLANKGPFSRGALFPALKPRPDFTKIVTTLFQGDIGKVVDDEKLTLTQSATLHLEYALLSAIQWNLANYTNDNAVTQKVAAYAQSTAHLEIYTMALLAYERSGKDMTYFETMLADKTIPEQKVRLLNVIIDRIRNGRRLKPELPAAAVSP